MEGLRAGEVKEQGNLNEEVTARSEITRDEIRERLATEALAEHYDQLREDPSQDKWLVTKLENV